MIKKKVKKPSPVCDWFQERREEEWKEIQEAEKRKEGAWKKRNKV